MTVRNAAIAGGVLAGLAAGACYTLGWLIASLPEDPHRAAWEAHKRHPAGRHG